MTTRRVKDPDAGLTERDRPVLFSRLDVCGKDGRGERWGWIVQKSWKVEETSTSSLADMPQAGREE
jgi:hypothetical protein